VLDVFFFNIKERTWAILRNKLNFVRMLGFKKTLRAELSRKLSKFIKFKSLILFIKVKELI